MVCPIQVPITETAILKPINPYGRTKLIIEQMLSDFDSAHGLKSVALRYFNAAGADREGKIGECHEPETHLIPLVLNAAINTDKPIYIFGTDYDTPDGTCIRDYIHVSDLADAHIKALNYLLDDGDSDIFNLGNGQGFSVREIIDAASRVTNENIRIIESDRRAGDPPILIGDYGKIQQRLGWKPVYTDIEDIITTAYDWHKKSLQIPNNN